MNNNDMNVISLNPSFDNLLQIKNENKRSLSDEDDDMIVNCVKSKNMNRRRRDDLTCVICEGPASGHNFGQISCSSCKEFFRRTALLPIEKTRCINKKNSSINIRCKIRFDIKKKCQCCRLIKCHQLGMRTDHLITPEEKLSKQQRIEENRRIRSREIIDKNAFEMTTIGTRCEPTKLLTDIDRSYLSHVENAYLSALRSIPSASSVISFNPSFNKTFSFIDLIEIDKFIPIKLINFLRLIPEFELLCENDRLSLVKYNFMPLLVLRDAFIYDPKSDLYYDDTGSTLRSAIDGNFAQYYKSLCILFYGYEFYELYSSHLRSIINIIDNDLLIIKLLMLVLIFLKGTSINDEHVWILFDPQSVFNAHLKYVDLLFRYLIDRYSFDIAITKMMQLIQNIFKIQDNAKLYQEKMQKEGKNINIHPLMKSLIGFT